MDEDCCGPLVFGAIVARSMGYWRVVGWKLEPMGSFGLCVSTEAVEANWKGDGSGRSAALRIRLEEDGVEAAKGMDQAQTSDRRTLRRE